MHKHAETLNANKSHKLAIAIFMLTSPFSKYKFVVYFSNIFCTKTSLCAPPFLYENKLL